jgi:hypothetical protein
MSARSAKHGSKSLGTNDVPSTTNSGTSTPERERKGASALPERPGQPAPFAGTSAGVGAGGGVQEDGSERVELRVRFEYEMKHAYSQLGVESDDFVEWRATVTVLDGMRPMSFILEF